DGILAEADISSKRAHAGRLWPLVSVFTGSCLANAFESLLRMTKAPAGHHTSSSSKAEPGTVIIYTDGGCKGNPGPGGWGALLLYQGHEREIWGGEPLTTNNRMELMAAIAALDTLKRACRVELHTDSQYLRDGITVWIGGWKAKGWKTSQNK